MKTLSEWKRIYVNPCRLVHDCPFAAQQHLEGWHITEEQKPNTAKKHYSLFSTVCRMTSPLHISFQEGTHSSARGSGIWLYRIIQAWKDSPAFCTKQDHLSAQTRLLRALSSWVLKTSKDGNCSTSLGKLFQCWTTCCYRCHWNQ